MVISNLFIPKRYLFQNIKSIFFPKIFLILDNIIKFLLDLEIFKINIFQLFVSKIEQNLTFAKILRDLSTLKKKWFFDIWKFK